MELIGKARNKLRHGLVVKWLLDRFTNIGLELQPYYIVLEGTDPGLTPQKIAGYRTVLLGPDDMQTLHCVDGRGVTARVLREWLREGKLCVALKHADEIAAFTWVDLDEFNFHLNRFSLKDNEAYLFDMYTMKAFRGAGLAAHLRHQVYVMLRSMGRDRLYSVSEYFNSSSIRFKEKLGGRILRASLYVCLFRRWRFHQVLFDYTERPAEAKPLRRRWRFQRFPGARRAMP